MQNFMVNYGILDAIRNLNAKDERKVKLLIENTAAKYSFNEDLNNLIQAIEPFPELGWCLDTAHSNAAGVSFDQLRQVLKRKPPELCHANYPGSPFGCGRDRHGWRSWNIVLEGEATEPNSGMTPAMTEEWDNLIRQLHKLNVPLILEGGSFDDGNMKRELDLLQLILKTESPAA
jgi:sugar phosphate isomerase/epimerase